MKALAWIAAQIVALLVYQAAVMERQDEVRNEKRYVTISGDVSSGRALMMHVTLLFTGSFRSLAADFLWLWYDKASEEHKYVEAYEYMTLLLLLQNKNVEVWIAVTHDLTHNLPAVTPQKDRWPLIKKGYEKLAQANREIPNSPTLHWETGYRLVQKVSWSRPELDMEIIRSVREDATLQEVLVVPDYPELLERPPGAPPGRSPFELSMGWFRKAGVLSQHEVKRKGKTYRTAFGARVDQTDAEGWIWHAMFYEAMYCWLQGRHDDALWWLERKLIPHNEEYVAEYGGYISQIYGRRLDMVRRIVPLVRAHQAFTRAPTAENAGAFIDPALAGIRDFRMLDDQFVTRHVSEVRMLLVQGLLAANNLPEGYANFERAEVDDEDWCAQPMPNGAVLNSWVFPSSRDQDVYAVLAGFGGAVPGSPPRAMELNVVNKPLGGLPGRYRLHVRLVSFHGGSMITLADGIAEPGRPFTYNGAYDPMRNTFLYISALDGTAEPAP